MKKKSGKKAAVASLSLILKIVELATALAALAATLISMRV
jgi:hypothetical protein